MLRKEEQENVIDDQKFKSKEFELQDLVTMISKKVAAKQGISVIRRNLSTNGLSLAKTGLPAQEDWYTLADMPQIVHVTRPRFILLNNEFELIIKLDHSLKVEYSISIQLSQTLTQIQIEWELSSQSAKNQDYICTIPSLGILGDFTISYWITNSNTGDAISELVSTSFKLTVVPSKVVLYRWA